MKLKGISIWEQHVEKIVLAVAILVFVALSSLQLLTNPNAQQIPGRGDLSPGQVDEFLKDKADKLLAQMGPEAAAGEHIPEYVPILPPFKKRITDPVSPEKTLAKLHYEILLNIPGVGFEGKPYFVPQPAAPAPIVVAQCANALAAEEVQKYEGLAAYFPAANEPYDLAWTMIACRWDMSDFLDQLQGKALSGRPDEPLAVPTPWHGNKTTITDVVFEREEQVGENWTNLTVLPPLPGRASFRTLLAGPIAGRDREDLLKKLSDPAIQAEVLRPAFYATKTEPCPPPDFNAQPGQQRAEDPVASLKRAIAKAKEELVKLQADLEKAGGPVEPKEPAKPAGPSKGKGDGGGVAPPGPGGGGVGTGSGGGPGKRQGGEDKNPATSPAGITQRKTLMNKIERKKAELTKLEADLEKLAAKPADGGPKPVVAEAGGLIDLWTHDITAQPGKTYRYRATVKVYSPFYGHKPNLVPEQQHLADELVLSSSASEWSQPIRVTPWLRHFITDATPPNRDRVAIGGTGLGSLVVDVFRFYDGHWHEERFTAAPGDRIGSKKTIGGRDGQPPMQIDFATDWYVVDILEDVSPAAEGGHAAAKAVLQTLNDQLVECRDPKTDLADPDFKWLKTQVEQVHVAHQ